MDNVDTTVIERLRAEQWTHLLPGATDVRRRARRHQQRRLAVAAASLAMVGGGSVAATVLHADHRGADIRTGAAPVSSDGPTAFQLVSAVDAAPYATALPGCLTAGHLPSLSTSLHAPSAFSIAPAAQVWGSIIAPDGTSTPVRMPAPASPSIFLLATSTDGRTATCELDDAKNPKTGSVVRAATPVGARDVDYVGEDTIAGQTVIFGHYGTDVRSVSVTGQQSPTAMSGGFYVAVISGPMPAPGTVSITGHGTDGSAVGETSNALRAPTSASE